MKKKIVLVRLRSPLNIITPPLGIGYLIKSIQRLDDIEIKFIDSQRDKLGKDECKKMICESEPLLLGFQVFSNTYRQFQLIVKELREAFPGTTIIAGGPHVSGIPELVIKENPGLDYAVFGEGEEALFFLLKYLIEGTLEENISSIPNLCYRLDNNIKKNHFEFVDVKKYGSPAWEYLEPEKYPAVQHGTFHKSTRVVPIITSRGCPYPCTFCAGHCLSGRKIRVRDIPEVVDEIEFLMKKYRFKEFIVEDENFTFFKNRVKEFYEETFKRKLKFFMSFPNGLKVEKLDEEVVNLLKNLGTYSVVLGLESGSERVLKSMKKRMNFDEIREKIQLLHKNNIQVTGSFILGFRDETIEDIRKTIQFSLDSNIDLVYFGNYLPLPGSEDYQVLVERGEINPDKINWEAYSSYNGMIPYKSKYLEKYDLLKIIRNATIKFYLRPKIILHFLKRLMHPVFMRNLIIRAFYLFFKHKQT